MFSEAADNQIENLRAIMDCNSLQSTFSVTLVPPPKAVDRDESLAGFSATFENSRQSTGAAGGVENQAAGRAPEVSEEELDVRIAIIGDGGVGKTSIITTLLDDEFWEDVPACHEPVTIPPDVTPDHVAVRIRDYSARVQQPPETLIELIRWANVIIIVYSIFDETSGQRVTSHWLPLVQAALGGPEHGRPVLLVANKSDRRDGVANEVSKMVKIMNEFLEIETVVECSAKILKNVSEIFMYAQKAVIYPFRPLFHVEDRELTQKCKLALARIFKISDEDNDGLLTDEELRNFQLRCFNVPLTRVAIEGVKQVIRDHDPTGVHEQALTINGFFYLHQLFIQRGKYDTVWTILKRFGYDLDLKLSRDYLVPKLKALPKGSSLEFSEVGLQFITRLFRKFDEDHDEMLSPAELQNLFSACPSRAWPKEYLNCVETGARPREWLTLNGYLNLWALSLAVEPTHTFERLAYLGFNVVHKELATAVTVTRQRHLDVAERSTERAMFTCHVIGPRGAGKTVFCRSLAGKSQEKCDVMPRGTPPYVMNIVRMKDGYKHLMLREVDVCSPRELLTDFEKSADVICLLYDASHPDSFAYCASVYLRYFYRVKVACLFVATKSEEGEAEQNYEYQPTQFCEMHQLSHPVRFRHTDIGRPDAAVFSRLVTLAAYPHMKKVFFLYDANLLSKVSFGAAIAALAGFLIYKNLS